MTMLDNSLTAGAPLAPLLPTTNFGQAFNTMGVEAGFSEVFDSLNWVFDGIPDSFVAPPVI